jgi:hypothetical protein
MALLRPLGLVLTAALALGACQSSRLGGSAPVVARAPVASAPGALEPVEAVPSGTVSSAPLAPPPGTTVAEVGISPGPGPVVADVPTTPPPAPTVVASVAPPATAAPSGRSAMVGAWTARDATGSTCRVQLSSSPALDLYRASASACANKDLGRVSAWDYRDGEVYLYQSGGAVAARLRGGTGGLEGVLAKSGAPLALSR